MQAVNTARKHSVGKAYMQAVNTARKQSVGKDRHSRRIAICSMYADFGNFWKEIGKSRPLGRPEAFSGPGAGRGGAAADAKIGAGPTVLAFSRNFRARSRPPKLARKPTGGEAREFWQFLLGNREIMACRPPGGLFRPRGGARKNRAQDTAFWLFAGFSRARGDADPEDTPPEPSAEARPRAN